ncbi:MAG: SURF1 family protein [Xanthomonadales bacterium]|nr:SURF1 family protein [Xanthomonadales bacterium]
MKGFSWRWLLLSLLLAAGFARLGWWQWQRAAEKSAWQAELAVLSAQPPRPLTQVLGGDVQRGVPVQVDGEVLPPTLLLDNQTRDGRAGVLVLARLRVDGVAEDLLVVRGWLPLTDGVRALPRLDPLPSRMHWFGHLDRPPAAGLSLGATPGSLDQDPALLMRVDPDWLADQWQRPLLPWVLYLDPAAEQGFDRDWSPRSLPPERHRGYAAQWWGLALAVLLVYGVLSWRARRRNRARKAM